MRRTAATILAALAACAGACAGAGPRAADPRDALEGPAARAWHYRFALDPALEVLSATVCFEGPAPAVMRPGDPDAMAYVRSARWVRGDTGAAAAGGAAFARVGPRGVALGGARAGDCLAYDVVLDVPVGSPGTLGMRTSRGGDALLSTNLWLLFPERRAPGAAATARFELPAGVGVSVPWPRAGDGGAYRVEESAFQLAGFGAFGRLAFARVPAARGAVFEVAGLEGALPGPLDAWVGAAGRAVSAVFGGAFPEARTQVLLLQDRRDRVDAEPVPFGLTSHAGGESVLLVWRGDAAPGARERDGTAIHELVHVAQPLLRDEDAWLSEGVATYYEQVLRARAGLVGAAEAWGELARGFERGRAGAARSGGTLAEDAARMASRGTYARVYWTGAAIALLADVETRRATRGAASLDTLARAVAACCRDRARRWTADEVIARMDRAAGTRVMADLAARYLGSPAFPDVAATMRALGAGGTSLDDAAPLARVRAAITAP